MLYASYVWFFIPLSLSLSPCALILLYQSPICLFVCTWVLSFSFSMLIACPYPCLPYFMSDCFVSATPKRAPFSCLSSVCGFVCSPLSLFSFSLLRSYQSPILCSWILMCLFKFPDWENRRWQSLHWYGFSPEWILRCFVRVLESEKAFLHMRHLAAKSDIKSIIFPSFVNLTKPLTALD